MMSSSPRRGAPSRARPRRKRPRRECRCDAGRGDRDALDRPHGAPAGELHPAARLSDDAPGRELRRARLGDGAPGFPDRLVSRLRAGRAVHPGRALLDDERGHRPRARHPDGVPQPSLADAAARLGPARRHARRGRRARAGADGVLRPRRPRRGRRLPRGPARHRRPLRLRVDRLARLRRARLLHGAAHRLGRGDPGALPAPVRLPLHLLDEHAAEPDRDRLVPCGRHREPGLVLARVRAQPGHHGLGRRGARARLRGRRGDRRRRDRARRRRAQGEAGPDVRIWPVASGVAWRTLKNIFTNPSLLVPSIIFPLFFFTAFAGGLSRVAKVPGFDFPSGYTAFQFVFVLLQSAAFGGVFTGFGIARDFESGFARRLLLASPNRSEIVLGYAFAAVVRWLVTASLLTVIALAARMEVGGNAVDLSGLY